MRPAAAAALLAALAAAALLATRTVSVALIAGVLLLVCLQAPADRRRLYLVGALLSGLAVVVLTPFVETIGSHPIWTGPTVPVLGQLDITREELHNGLFQGLRLTAVALAFAAYALLLDHDRLVQAAGFARRSVLTIALATRLVPTLERDALGSSSPCAGAGWRCAAFAGVRGCSGRCSPGRSSGRSTSRRRWRRAATASPAQRGRRGRGGPLSTGSHWSRPWFSWRWGRCGSSDGLGADVPLSGRARRAPGLLAAIEPGEVVGLFGPSGCGKSTLLRALAGLVPHFHGGSFSGRVEVAGLDTRRVRPAELARTVGTLFQDPRTRWCSRASSRGRVRAREHRDSACRDRAAHARGARLGRGRASRRSAGGGALGRRAAARLPSVGAGAPAEAHAARRADLPARPRRSRGGDRARALVGRRGPGLGAAARACARRL